MKAYNEKGDGLHYNSLRIATMRTYENTYGTLAMLYFCEINAQKYKDRLGKKENQPIEQELLKISWYEKAARFYYDKIRNNQIIPGVDATCVVGPEILQLTLKEHKLPWD